jgi:hypothetical protein
LRTSLDLPFYYINTFSGPKLERKIKNIFIFFTSAGIMPHYQRKKRQGGVSPALRLILPFNYSVTEFVEYDREAVPLLFAA